MIEGRRSPCLISEPALLLVAHNYLFGKELECDGAPELRILRLEHNPHPTLTELLENLVMGYYTADHSGCIVSLENGMQ
jgi:hypothetical protein